MPFTTKSWQNSPSTSTPLSAAALVDLEQRLSAYSETVSTKFEIDSYAGADPTGATLSDAAWTSCYAAAVAAVQGSGGGSTGAMIVFGPGIYKFSINTVKISDYRIGMCGKGKQVTSITSSGNNGDIVYITDSPTPSTFQAAPVHGFTIYGAASGANVNGFHYGDRCGALIDDIEVWNCDGTGSRGAYFKNDNGSTAGCEGTFCRMTIQGPSGVASVCFDGNNNSPAGSNSFDYSDWSFLIVTGNATTQNHSVVQIINQGALSGSRLRACGNAAAASTFTTTWLVIGASTSDKALLDKCDLHMIWEANASGGTVKDIAIQADASFAGGLYGCLGSFIATDVGATTVAGSVTGSALFSMAGRLKAPIFNTVGQLSGLGQSQDAGFQVFDYYANNIKVVFDYTGAVRPGSTTGQGVGLAGPATIREWSGSGVPTTPGGAITYIVNDRYWRTDGAAGTRLYICTAGGGSPTWAAIAGI